MVSPPPEKSKHGETECALELFEKKTPPGGENVVVMYTTTLRGIRKTYEDCNRLRSLIESHDVYTIERDVSMDSGFREELRALMGEERSEIRLPVVFVKGRLIGGVEELVKIEEEGKLGGLFGGFLNLKLCVVSVVV
ncbi:hypothetical protein Syun_002539 [Stephania yunnanensis]|uniref:Glutaredoxin domain-containing protein n=1 Tax=Stephania yunnanensis TaxID=152371 RepID=A0AAP0LJW4_9MAGN